MAGANGDSFLIENRADVVRVDAVDHEREHAGLFFRGADQSNAGNRRNRFGRVGQQIVLVRGDVVDAEAVHVARSPRPDR